MSTERWLADIVDRAAAYWTPARSRDLLGDKRLLLPPVEAAPLLRVLGLLKGDGSMPPEALHKYFQINHMVLLLEPAFLDLIAAAPMVRVLDGGCGRSSLTMLLAWCFRHRWRHPAQLLGVDRASHLVTRSRERAETLGLGGSLRFEEATLDGLDIPALWAGHFGAPPPGEAPLQALISLHACDGATDQALALGVSSGAQLIACAPCCQAELARKWAAIDREGRAGAFAPLWGAPHLRREAAATITDAMRTLLLRGCGYRVTPMEFVPSSHTPKNTLLRATLCGGPKEEPLAQYLSLREATGGAGLGLEALLPEAPRALLLALQDRG